MAAKNAEQREAGWIKEAGPPGLAFEARGEFRRG